MNDGELDELMQIEKHLTWLVDLVQRRIDACGAGEGLNNPARQAEALAGIEENKRIVSAQASANLLPTTAELEEVNWLNEHVGQVHAAQARALAIPQCVSSTTSKTKKSAKSR